MDEEKEKEESQELKNNQRYMDLFHLKDSRYLRDMLTKEE